MLFFSLFVYKIFKKEKGLQKEVLLLSTIFQVISNVKSHGNIFEKRLLPNVVELLVLHIEATERRWGKILLQLYYRNGQSFDFIQIPSLQGVIINVWFHLCKVLQSFAFAKWTGKAFGLEKWENYLVIFSVSNIGWILNRFVFLDPSTIFFFFF